MSKPKIGIVISTTREGRFADRPTQWILELVNARDDLAGEIIDLRDYPMRFYDEPKPPIYVPPADPGAVKLAAKVASLDGFIFVTAEYNRAPPGVLKNALDHVYNEFIRKPAAFVGYGGVGAARAIEQLRLIAVELQMAPTRSGVHIARAEFIELLGGKTFADLPHMGASAATMLNELAWWTKALKTAREAG